MLTDWRTLVDALADDAANEQRGDVATTHLVLLLRDSLHKATGHQLTAVGMASRFGICMAYQKYPSSKLQSPAIYTSIPGSQEPRGKRQPRRSGTMPRLCWPALCPSYYASSRPTLSR